MNAKELDELSKYSDLEGSELGDACAALVAMYAHREYLDEDCTLALEKEMFRQLKAFKKYTKIVERTATSTYTITELVDV